MGHAVLNPASVSALLSVGASLIGAVGAAVLGRAPHWDDVRPLTWVALTAAAAAACNLTATFDVPWAVYTWTGRAQILALALHVAAWYAYILQFAGPFRPRTRGLLLGPLLAAGALALVPGVVFGDAVTLRPVPWLGVVYHDPVITLPGFAVLGAVVAYGAAGIVRLATLRGRGVPYRRTLVVITSAILLMGVHDAVVVGGLSAPTPYLLDFGLYGPAIATAVLTLRRVVVTSTDLERLRAGLEVAVVERTAALERSQAALAASARLAGLGQFADGFALEVGQPLKVAEANLEALGRELRDDPRDRIWARLADASAALARIGALTRQLRLAGRAAAAPPSGKRVDVRVARAVEAVLASARARAAPGVELAGEVAPGLTASAQEEELVEVLTILVLHGVAGVRGGQPGRVTLHAEAAGERARIAVEDDGAPPSDEALLHAFEPFHASGGPRRAGLSLAVARGLVEGMGGTLTLARAPAGGVRAVVDLARGAPDASAADLPAAPVAAPRRARVLVADADPKELREVARELSAEHEVEAVASLPAALAAIAERSFDLVLCDVGLPGGGGERFWQELLLQAPALQARVAFIVGGAGRPTAAAFLARQPQPVLRRPFGLAEVQVALDWLGLAVEEGGTGGGPEVCGAAVGRIRGA